MFSLLYIIYTHYMYVSIDKLTSVHEPQITFIHHSIITSLFPEKPLLSFLSLRRLPSNCTPTNFLSLVMKNVRFVTKKYILWFYNYSKRLQGCLLSATSECLSKVELLSTCFLGYRVRLHGTKRHKSHRDIFLCHCNSSRDYCKTWGFFCIIQVTFSSRSNNL